jgi:hypothetical protein
MPTGGAQIAAGASGGPGDNETNEVETGNNHRVSGYWHRFLSPRLFLMPVFGE